MDRSKSKYWHAGYKYGDSMNLNTVPVPPKEYNDKQERDWQHGVNAAICDRMG